MRKRDEERKTGKKANILPSSGGRFAIEGVVAVSPQVSVYGHFVSGKYHANVTIVGVRRDIMDKLGFKVENGEMLSETASVGTKTFDCLFDF